MDQQSLKLFQMLQSGDICLSFYKQQAIFLLGMTKRGKTTSGHMLCNQPLQKVDQTGGSIILKPAGRFFSTAIIGSSHNSQTQIPNLFQANVKNKKISIIDCPGYEDTFGCYRTITNGYFRYRVFSKVKKSKFVLVLQASDLQGDIAGLRITISSFIETYKNYEQNENDILEATALLITKVSENKTKQNLKAIIKRIVQVYKGVGMSEKTKKKFNNLLKHMVDKDKIFIINLFDSDNKYTDTTTTILQQIINSTQFWQRQAYPNKTVDMSEIQFNILDEVQKNRNDKVYWDKFIKVLNTLQAKFKSVFNQGIRETLQTLVKDAQGKQQSRNFVKIIQKIVEQHYKYNQQYENSRKEIYTKLFEDKENQLQKNIKSYQIKKFGVTNNIEKIFKRIQQATQNEDQFALSLRSEKFLSFMQDNILTLLKSFRSLSTSKIQIEILFPKYFYVIYRTFEQLKIFFILLNKGTTFIKNQKSMSLGQFPDCVRPMKDTLDVLCGVSLKQEKKDFIMKFQSNNSNQYQQIKTFIDQMQKQSESLSNRLKIKQIFLQVSLSQKQSLSNLKPELVIERIRKLNQARQFFEKILLQNNERIIQPSEQTNQIAENLIQTVKILGQTMLYFRLLQQALICFKSIKDVFQVIQAYGLLVEQQKTKSQKRKVLIQLALYAFSHCRTQLGFTKLQQAYSYSKTIQQIDQVSDLLTSYAIQQRGKLGQKYILSLIKSGYYQPISIEKSNKLKTINIDDINKGLTFKKIQGSRKFI